MNGVDLNLDVHVIMVDVPSHGHVRPLCSLARSLAMLGYPMTFITGDAFVTALQAIAEVEFVPL